MVGGHPKYTYSKYGQFEDCNAGEIEISTLLTAKLNAPNDGNAVAQRPRGNIYLASFSAIWNDIFISVTSNVNHDCFGFASKQPRLKAGSNNHDFLLKSGHAFCTFCQYHQDSQFAYLWLEYLLQEISGIDCVKVQRLTALCWFACFVNGSSGRPEMRDMWWIEGMWVYNLEAGT